LANDKTINITAKIANLQAIRDELSKLKVNLKIESPELKQLQEMAKKGLTIDIRFKVGPELKQLLDLQKQGININVGGGGTSSKPLAVRNTILVSEAESLFNLGKTNFKSDKVQQHLDRLDALEAAERKRQIKQLEQLRKRRASANNYVAENPLDALLGNDVIGAASSKFGVGRSSITSRPNFFNLGRLKDPKNLQNILFTTLLGGGIQGAGAALGTATLGPAGGLLGATIAKTLTDQFNNIAESMTRAVKAGAEYERAVTGITGIFQATSEIVGRDGNALPIGQQLAIQTQRAEGIQKASQRALLPLGITGGTASALTQSLSAGLAQRGLAPDEKSTEILLRRFGAAIQTLQPELAGDPNLIRRGFEDVIGGGPQASRTELGSAIRGLAPGLFSKNIKSVDDIIKATASLEELVTAIRNNDKATVEWKRALSSLELAQQELGKGFLEGIAPGLKVFADALQDDKTSSALKELGTVLGEMGSSLIGNTLPALKGFLNQLDAIRQKLGFGSSTTGDEGLTELNKKRAAKGQIPLVRNEQTGQLQEANAQQTIQSILQTAKNRFGIEDPTTLAGEGLLKSPQNKLLGIRGLRSTLRKRLKSGEFAAEIGLNNQEIEALQQIQANRAGLFDSSEEGQFRRAQSDKGALRDQIKLAEDSVSKRRALLKIEEAKGSEASEESIVQARIAVQQAEEEAIKLRNQAADKEKEIAEKRLAIFQKQLSAIDQTTFKGKSEALALQGTFNLNQGLDIGRRISAQQSIIDSKTASPQEKAAARDRLASLQVERQANQTATADQQRGVARNQLNKLAFDVQNPLRREATADAASKSQLELQQLGISTKELVLEQNKLTRSLQEATKALSDFKDNARLRQLGQEGEEIAAAEAIVAAGGAVPAGVSEALVKGAAGFDPEARAEFERRVAEEKFGQTRRDSNDFFNREDRQEAELKDGVAGLKLDQEKLNLKPEELRLQRNNILRDQKTQAIENAKAAQAALEQDPDNPQLQQEYASAYSKLQGIKKEQEAGALVPGIGGATSSGVGKKGTFSINGEPVVPSSVSGLNISSAGATDLIASNDVGNAILSGVSGAAYGKARESSAKGAAIGEEILRGLSGDRSDDAKGKKDIDNPSVFDRLQAYKPLTQSETRDAFIQALNQSFT
jgi:hypothetical protein